MIIQEFSRKSGENLRIGFLVAINLPMSLFVNDVHQAMAVVNTRKMKFSPLKGSFSEKGLNEFLL